MNLEIEMPDYDEIPLPSDAADAVEDGRVYNMTDYSFYYKLKDCDTNSPSVLKESLSAFPAGMRLSFLRR